MAVEVSGVSPVSAIGRSFRSTQWWWDGIWSYTISVVGEERLAELSVDHEETDDSESTPESKNLDLRNPQNGFGGAGWSITAEGAEFVAGTLRECIENGHAADTEREWRVTAASVEPCWFCDGTGVRTDPIAIRNGLHEQELAAEVAAEVGRDFGTCNGCGGYGKSAAAAPSSNFSIDRVSDFAKFVEDSGGFHIR